NCLIFQRVIAFLFYEVIKNVLIKWHRFIIISLMVSIFCIAQAATLSLQQARDLSLKNNHSFKSAELMKKSAEQKSKASFTHFLPSFNLGGTYMQKGDVYKVETDLIKLPVYQYNPTTGTASAIAGQFVPLQLDMEIDDEDAFVFSVNMTQPIFTGGKVLNQYKLHKNLEAIESQKMQLTEEEIIIKTDEAYWRVVALVEKVKLAEQFKTTVQKHLEDLENYKAVGIITQNEILKASVKLNEAELNLLKAKNGLALSKMALNQILGTPLNQDLDLSDQLTASNQKNAGQTSIEEALQRRPELQMLKSATEIAGNNKSIQFSRYLPNIMLNASYNFMNPNPYNSLKDETGKDWTIALIASMELFHWNERGYSLSSAKNLEKAALLKYDETRELLTLEMKQSDNMLNESIQKVMLTKTGVDQATENLKYCNDKFSQGMLKSADVLDAQTLWQKAQSDYLDALSELKVNEIKHAKVYGQLL
ncbi:MAG TPA: TolC family protein, partial [Candidatus Cloacimonadota bacterium]|nr:TolC family protein [Candidatus Cloacimonadota bacterium]